MLDADETLLVTNYIIVETTALVQHRLGMDAVRALTTEMVPVLDVHWISEVDHLHAQNALLATDRRRLSLVDCSSFHIMRTRLLRSAFAFDPHFHQHGFELLPSLEANAGKRDT